MWIPYLTLDKMSYPCLGHYGYRHGGHDFFDELRVRHTGNATLGSNIGGDTLEGHDGAGTGFFCYPSLVE